MPPPRLRPTRPWSTTASPCCRTSTSTRAASPSPTSSGRRTSSSSRGRRTRSTRSCTATCVTPTRRSRASCASATCRSAPPRSSWPSAAWDGPPSCAESERRRHDAIRGEQGHSRRALPRPLVRADRADPQGDGAGEGRDRPHRLPGRRAATRLDGAARGTVEVFKEGRGKKGTDEVLATIPAPTVLGEISLLTEGPHTASVRAKTACEFSLLTTTQFHRLLREESLAAYKVIATLAEVLARRLHRMDEKFVEVSRKSPSAHVEELTAFKQKLFTEWSF